MIARMTRQMSPAELAERLASKNPPRLLDVRESEESQRVALPNSRFIPLDELAERCDEIEQWKEEEIVVYCHHGVRSLYAIHQLSQLGFSKLRNLAGGIDAWAAEVDPTLPRY